MPDDKASAPKSSEKRSIETLFEDENGRVRVRKFTTGDETQITFAVGLGEKREDGEWQWVEQEDVRHGIFGYPLGLSPYLYMSALKALVDELCQKRANVELEVAAYLLDRAGQYVEDSCCRIALEDMARKVAKGEAQIAAAHGELDDLVNRVLGFRR